MAENMNENENNANIRVDQQFRRIYLSGEFTDDAARQIVTTMLELEFSDQSKDIVIYIDSDGGKVDSFMAMYDAVNLCRCRVATFCIGRAMSCGALLLLSGTPGLRFISPNSRVMMHELWGITAGSLSQMKNTLTENERLKNIIKEIIFKNTRIKPKDLKTMFSKDYFMSSQDAVKYGIVDHVIESNHDLFEALKV